ncbi:phage tail protein [Nocardia farcinica]|uniref:phage tail protein n=1 Tax=Nocardia farcinica TaxID=37329 RepID=UPI001892DF68|nr:hypothetical protein [Nocardia farcinica]MBF6411198.1 hypothetical protein [Nocardia farcinica]
MATAYATLEVIPTVRGISSRIGDQISRPLNTAGRKAGRDAGAAIREGIEREDYEGSGRSAAARFTRGFTAGMRGISAGFGVAIKAANLFAVNAGAIATTMGLASKLVRSFSAATFISAVALRQVASTGLTRLAGALRLIAAIASRVAGEIGQITAAFLVMQAVVRTAQAMTTFARRLAMLTVGGAAAIGVVSGLGTIIGGALVSALTAGAVALGAFAGAAAGLGGPALFALKVGFKGLADAAGTFGEEFKEADDAFNKMVGQRMGPMLTAWRTMRMEMVDRFSAELTPAFQRIGVGMDLVRGKAGWMSVYMGQIGQGIADSLTAPETIGAFQRLGDASGAFFQHLNTDRVGLGSLASGLVQFAATAATTFQDSSRNANAFFEGLAQKLASITPDQIRAALGQFQQVFTNIGNVAGPIFGLFRQMGQISAAALAPGFAAVGSAITQATPALVNMANIIMPALGEVMQRLAPLIPALVQAFTPWASTLAAIAPPLASVVAHMAPLAPYLLMVATGFKVAGGVMLLWNAATFAGSVAQGVFAAAMGRSAATLTGNTIALAAHRIALIAGAVAARAFGAAMAFATGPVGLIIAAVAAVGVALWAFFTKTETGKKWWEVIWNGIKTAVAVTWEFLKGAWQWILTGIQWIGDKANWLWSAVFQPVFGFIGSLISQWWTGIVQPAFTGVKAAFEVVGNVISWWWQSIVQPAFNAVSAVIAWWWNDFASPMLHNFQVLIGLVGTAISAWWQGVAEPAFRGVGAVISWLWDTVGSPVFENFKTGIGVVGEAFSFFKDNVVDPVFKGIGTAISTAWDTVGSPVFDSFKTGIGAVGDAFGAAGRTIESVWNSVLSALRPVAHAIGNVLASVPQSIGPFEVPGADTANALGAKLQAFRGGGLIRGAGGPTDDANIIRVSDREHLAYITRAQAANPATLPFLEAINNGWTPPAWLLHEMIPGFAGGGLVSTEQLRDFARGIEGARYTWGGWGAGWSTDCSGAGSAVANYAVHQLPAGQGQRSGTGNMASFLGSLGAQPGLGPAGSMRWGWYNGGPYGGHLAMTLPTGEHVEMGGARGNGQFGGQAAGAEDGMFTEHAHLPPEFFLGGDLGGGASAGGGGLGTAGNLGGGGLGTGGTGGTGGGTTTGGGANSAGGATTRPPGTAVPVWVDNWPPSMSTGSGLPASTTPPTTTTTTAAGAPSSITPTGDATDGQFDQAAAFDTALSNGRAGFAKAGEAFLRGQIGATPFGQAFEGLEKAGQNLTLIVADVAEAIDRWRTEQRRQAMAAGARF